MGNGTLPIVQAEQILVNENQPELIVGTDFPNFKGLLLESCKGFQPTDWVLKNQGDSNGQTKPEEAAEEEEGSNTKKIGQSPQPRPEEHPHSIRNKDSYINSQERAHANFSGDVTEKHDGETNDEPTEV